MAIVDLGKLRFHFAGEWLISTAYEINDVVKYGGNVYVYTHSVKEAGVLPTNTSHWAILVKGINFVGVFSTGTSYRVGDSVAHGGKIYVSILDSTNQTPPNITYWSLFADGIQYEGVYSGITPYQLNDVVIYGGKVYIAKQDTTGNLPTATAYWDKFVDGISPQGVYNNATSYVPGDVVAYAANIYIALVNVTGVLPSSDPAKWQMYIGGLRSRGPWTTATSYTLNDVVMYGGSLYIALTNHTSTGFDADLTAVKWQLYVGGFRSTGPWTTSTSYAFNDVVVYGGNTYISQSNHVSTTFAADLAAVKWVKFNSGIRYRGDWLAGTSYLVDDIAISNNSTYIATLDHTAGTFVTDLAANKWSVFALGQANVPTPIGQTDGLVIKTLSNAYVLGTVEPVIAVISSNTTAVKSATYMLNSTSGSFILTLPASPSPSDVVYIRDGAKYLQTYPVTVSRNGSKIDTYDEDLLLDVNDAQIILTYINSIIGWKLN
jgi:hypothetical protein